MLGYQIRCAELTDIKLRLHVQRIYVGTKRYLKRDIYTIHTPVSCGLSYIR